MNNPPQFAQLSTQQQKAKKESKLLTREGHMMDLIKTNPWRNLHNY